MSRGILLAMFRYIIKKFLKVLGNAISTGSCFQDLLLYHGPATKIFTPKILF